MAPIGSSTRSVQTCSTRPRRPPRRPTSAPAAQRPGQRRRDHPGQGLHLGVELLPGGEFVAGSGDRPERVLGRRPQVAARPAARSRSRPARTGVYDETARDASGTVDARAGGSTRPARARSGRSSGESRAGCGGNTRSPTVAPPGASDRSIKVTVLPAGRGENGRDQTVVAAADARARPVPRSCRHPSGAPRRLGRRRTGRRPDGVECSLGKPRSCRCASNGHRPVVLPFDPFRAPSARRSAVRCVRLCSAIDRRRSASGDISTSASVICGIVDRRAAPPAGRRRIR